MFLNEVVIGSSVQSMLYAFFTDRYHILNPSFLPLFYERLDMNIFGTKNTKEIWTRLKLMNSFLGKELGGVNSVVWLSMSLINVSSLIPKTY